MGAPSQDQIDECIADGLARGLDEKAIFKECATLERLNDEELAQIGVMSPGPRACARVEA